MDIGLIVPSTGVRLKRRDGSLAFVKAAGKAWARKGPDGGGGSWKNRPWTIAGSVLKLTQVGVVNNLRGSRKRS